MKKIIAILTVYTAVIFGGCVAFSFFYGNLPQLLPGAENGYKFFRALQWFLMFLPAILLTGFMAGCTAQWKVRSNANVARFSPGMFTRFKHIFIVGLIIAAVLTFSEEIFVSLVDRHQKTVTEAPEELTKQLFFVKKYQLEGKPLLAWQYAKLAYKTAPSNETAVRLLKETEDTLERLHDNASNSQGQDSFEHITTAIKTADSVYTVKELLDKSDAEAAAGNWFNAHYWASLALQACSGTDTNRSRAQDAANEAWNQLSNPSGFNNEAEKNYFAKKKEGYAALNSGDNLKAYYIFTTLSRSSAEHAEDPDVVRYLAISKERVESDYFFIDETTDLRFMESVHDIYFSLPYADGGRLVLCIGGAVSLEETGGYIRYLDGFNVAQYDSRGRFVRFFTVPFAKVMAVPVTVLDEETKAILGVQKNWRSIPYVQLQSVDRVTEGIVSKPEYSYSESGIPAYIAAKFNIRNTEEFATDDYVESGEEPTYILLPMNYDDFDLLGEVSQGADFMSLLTLRSFIPRAEQYGFSKEVYNQSFVKRITYPFYILILVIVAASFAWNYRITDVKEAFRFRWIFMFPLITIMLYVALDIFDYLFTLFNYLMVGLCGGFAFVALCIFYTVLVIVVSIVFLSRRAN